MTSAPVGYSPVSQHAHQDHVINALITMNGRRDALALVEINGETQLKTMGLFERFISLFLLSKTERNERFNAQVIVQKINDRIHEGVPELSDEQLNQMKTNLRLLNQRLEKKNNPRLSLQASINRLNAPAFQTQHDFNGIQELKPAISENQPPLAFNQQEFRAAYKGLRSDLAALCYDPTIQVEPLDCRRTAFVRNPSAIDVQPGFYRQVEAKGLSFLNRAQDLFDRGDEHLTNISADKKYELVRLLDEVIMASQDLPDSFELRKNVWRRAKDLASTIPPSEGSYSYRDAYCDAIKRRTVS